MGVIPPKHPLLTGSYVVWALSLPSTLRDAIKARATQNGVNASRYAVALLVSALEREDETPLKHPKHKR